jgi:signal transduction histidine kinase
VPRLIVIKGADEGTQVELSDPVLTIGRDGTNQIRLHDTEVSRRHAEFRKSGDDYEIVDTNSANGTFVNNQKVERARLQSGDHIAIGQSILVYSGVRTGERPPADLAEHIRMIARPDDDWPSAIIKTIGETEGGRILAQPEETASPWLKTALANLSIMYETIQAVSHILDLDQLIDRIMELIFSSIEADRGTIMLRNPDSGHFEPKAVRWREGVNRQETIFLSRTIMEYVLKEKQGVLVSDAASDDRFNAGQSIVRFGIREAICVPMTGRHETLGVIYLDTQRTAKEIIASESSAGKFTEDHLALAIAIAHQAALAVEATRYHHAMVQAERLAAIGQTIAGLSHHIKNILQGLKSGGEILKMGIDDKDDKMLQQGWKIVEKNQGKIYDLVMDMLSFSKEREPCIQETRLNQVARDVVELMSNRVQEKGVQLEMHLDENLPLVAADPEGIHRALLNILTNALDAVESQDKPRVVIQSMLDAEDGWVRIQVLDNGTGIPARQLAEIFKPFVSTKGSKGTGLGLAVSRQILREHGGDILAQSTLGKGSRFVLRLPIRSPIGSESLATRTESL